MKFFDNFKNKHGILSQKFAAGATKLWPPDEIRRFDGMSLPSLDGFESFFNIENPLGILLYLANTFFKSL